MKVGGILRDVLRLWMMGNAGIEWRRVRGVHGVSGRNLAPALKSIILNDILRRPANCAAMVLNRNGS